MAEYLVAFGSTHAALSFEAAFGPEGSLVPVPPKVRAGCGMGLLFRCPDDGKAVKRARNVACELGVEDQIDGLFAKELGSYRSVLWRKTGLVDGSSLDCLMDGRDFAWVDQKGLEYRRTWNDFPFQVQNEVRYSSKFAPL